MSDGVAETHAVLGALRDAFFRLNDLRFDVARAVDRPENRYGRTAFWGGSVDEDTPHAALGAWARKPDSSSVVWGITLMSTPRYLEIEAEIYYERDPDTHIELWSKVTTHDDVSDACRAIRDGVEELVGRASFIREIDRDVPQDPASDLDP